MIKKWLSAVLLLSVFGVSALGLRAQAMTTTVTCDASTILLLYLAEHDYGFHSMEQDAANFAKGQYAPLFETMMAENALAMDATETPPVTEAMMPLVSEDVLPALVVAGEASECTALRTELQAFFATTLGVTADALSSTAPLVDLASLPAWQTLPIVNSLTGETFTLADFNGMTVYVQPFATWCTNCRAQLNNVNEIIAQTDAEVMYLAISVETNVSAADLQTYAANNGFNMNFAVATPELLTELVGAFGRAIVSPPSTPHFVIRPDGSFTDLNTGSKSVDELLAFLQS